MAITLRVIEETPAARPAVSGLSTAAAAIEPETIWARLEGWCAHRWGVRGVVFIADGCGAWEAPLRPATITATERWDNGEWIAATLAASPFGGFELDGAGPYRFAASVGDVGASAGVLEAYRRLAEYLAEDAYTVAGAASVNVNLDGAMSVAFDRAPTWVARALSNSGAADLLRPYRNLGAV